MSNIGLLYRTVKHLKPTQVFYQMKNRLIKPTYVILESPATTITPLKASPIAKFRCWDGELFAFLNLEHGFAGWNFRGNGMLWAYNQNYFDWINQEGANSEECCKWIDRFICDLPNNRIGQDPYPIALRCVNWIKFFCQHPECAEKPRLDSLYSQLRLLEKKLEYHLLGNHLLEDAYALYMGASFFKEDRQIKKAEKLLIEQLREQILPDGVHFEQSPMYHCILLDRLLDCINIRETVSLRGFAEKMLGHLESVVWRDGSIPLLNDSANGIAPTPLQIFDYAKRLALVWKPIPMHDCGYRRLEDGVMEAIVDVGNMMASYQPGHSHADAFSYELRIDGKTFVVDTGISTYNKTERRGYERSTRAHNTVSVEGKNSSEVWGGFRVGKRAVVSITHDEDNLIEAIHDGFGKSCRRRFQMEKGGFVVEDWYDGEAVSYIHLAEFADVNRIHIEGALKTEMQDNYYSTEYNRLNTCMVLGIYFSGHLRYTIR